MRTKYSCILILVLLCGTIVGRRTQAGIIITAPSDLAGLPTATVTFGDLEGQNGVNIAQPYTGLGLIMGGQEVAEGANIGSVSEGIAVKSTGVLSGNTNFQNFSFSSGQQGVGFFFRDVLATGVGIEALGLNNNVLELITLPASAETRYSGFLRDSADIFKISISAPHATISDAFSSRTFIDDVTFGPVGVPEPSTIVLFATTAVCLFGYGWRRKRNK